MEIPESVFEDDTPIKPFLTEQGTMDVDRTLKYVVRELTEERRHRADSDSTQTSMREVAKNVTDYKWLWGGASIVSIIGSLFMAGITLQLWLGANATDAEVDQKVEAALIEHNRGVDPGATDPRTHAPVGDHPDLHKQSAKQDEAIRKLTVQTETLTSTQQKLRCLTEFQLAFTQWQSDVIEKVRRRRRPPGKPPELQRMENDLLKGRCP